MALGLRCFRLVHPAFCNSLAALTRPVSEVTMKTMSGRRNDHGQYVAHPAVPARYFATKKAKAKGKGQSQTRMNLNTALVEDIISLKDVDEEMKSVIEALKDNFNKTVNIRTSPGSLDHITVVTANGKLALNQIGQISMKSPQLILVNMASFPECTAAAIKAIRESGMNLNPEVEGTLIRVPIPKVTREHREMLVKLAKQNTNKAKDSLRKVRTNAMNKLKKSKDKTSEDTIRLIEKQHHLRPGAKPGHRELPLLPVPHHLICCHQVLSVLAAECSAFLSGCTLEGRGPGNRCGPCSRVALPLLRRQSTSGTG
uniref:Ribosome-recycling factor, mitochondrial n=1 Tax=Camelus bactrianus TaxID=9837 RepID=A0A9W3G717_CAMBA|nr:ribosome-recycling factor, mitochondrial isoform X1 [Camelus bactrianus]